MKFANTNEIQDELVNDVFSMYQYDLLLEKELSGFDKFNQIHEVLSFIFEDYRTEFERIMQDDYKNIMDKEQLRLEEVLFTSWSVHRVIYELKTFNKHLII